MAVPYIFANLAGNQPASKLDSDFAYCLAHMDDGTRGDIVITSTGTVLTVGPATITVAKMYASAQYVLFGRSSSGAGAGQEIASSATIFTFLGSANKAAAFSNLVDITVADGFGYLGAPQNSRSADYTLVAGDIGKSIYHPAADTTPRTWTIPANASVAFPIGTVILLFNENAAGAITIAITSDTLRWGSSTGSRTLAANGSAALTKQTATLWRLTGDGIT